MSEWTIIIGLLSPKKFVLAGFGGREGREKEFPCAFIEFARMRNETGNCRKSVVVWWNATRWRDAIKILRKNQLWPWLVGRLPA